MKKAGAYSFRAAGLLLAAALGCLCSCTRAQRDTYDPEVELRFDPVLLVATRSDGRFPEDRDFGVRLWDYSPGDETPSWNGFLPLTKISFDGTKWSPASSMLWPASSRRIAVQAHFPYGRADAMDLENGICFRDVDVERDQTDLLYSDLLRNLSKDDGGVIHIPFRHALCFVDITLRTNAQAAEKVVVKNVSLLNVGTKGNFRSLPEPGWTLSGERHGIELFHGNETLGPLHRTIVSGIPMIPQVLDAPLHVTIEFTGTEGFTRTISVDSPPLNKRLECGRHYTLSLSYFPYEEELVPDNAYHQGL